MFKARTIQSRCETCGKRILKYRPMQRFCSPKCRIAYHNEATRRLLAQAKRVPAMEREIEILKRRAG